MFYGCFMAAPPPEWNTSQPSTRGSRRTGQRTVGRKECPRDGAGAQAVEHLNYNSNSLVRKAGIQEVTLLTSVVGLVIVVIVGILSKDRIVENFYLRQFKTGDLATQERAIRLLAELGSEESLIQI